MSVVPLERRMYFTTAYAQLRNGCPMLALEVLLKLPSMIEANLTANKCKNNQLNVVPSTSVLNTIVDSKSSSHVKDISAEFDWSAPINMRIDDDDDALFLIANIDDNDDANIGETETDFL